MPPSSLQSQLLGACWSQFEEALTSHPIDMAEMQAAHMSYLTEAMAVCLLPAEHRTTGPSRHGLTSNTASSSVAAALEACEGYADAAAATESELWACHQRVDSALRATMHHLQLAGASDPAAAGLQAVLGCAFYDRIT